MPLPFLIVGGAWATAAYAAHKSQKEVQNKIEEYNEICNEIEKISEDSKALAEMTYDNYTTSVLQLDNLRQEIFYGTLTNFVQTFNKIRNAIELNDDLRYLPVMYDDTQITSYKASEHEIHRSNAFASPVLAGGIAVAFGAIGGGLMFLQGKMKKAQIEANIDEVNTVLAQVKSEAEQIAYKCSEMEYTISRLDLFYNTFCTLEKLVASGVEQMKYIIQQEGTDYRFYSVETREQLMVISNLAKLLRDFVKEDIVDYDGDITYDAENRYGECNKLLKSYGYDIPKKGDIVRISSCISRYWRTFEKSTKVKYSLPEEYYTYSWKVVDKYNNKCMIRANGITMVLLQDEISLR